MKSREQKRLEAVERNLKRLETARRFKWSRKTIQHCKRVLKNTIGDKALPTELQSRVNAQLHQEV